jgi:hypothetical protein
VVRPRIARARGFDGRDHKAIQRATLGHRVAPGGVWQGSRVRRRPLPAGVSRGSIPQTRSPAQGAARAAVAPDIAQRRGLAPCLPKRGCHCPPREPGEEAQNMLWCVR